MTKTVVGQAVTATAPFRDAAIALWGAAGEYAHDSYSRLLPLFPGLPDAIPHGMIARWPGSFRPADYNWGGPIDCPTY